MLNTILIVAGFRQFLRGSVFLNICAPLLILLTTVPPPSYLKSIQFSSVAQSCSNLCDPMDCCMPGFLVHHQILEFTQTHIHGVGDAI